MLPTDTTAKTMVQDVSAYLATVLQVKTPMTKWPRENSLPLYLTSSYAFFETRLMGRQTLLMVAKGNYYLTAQALSKHIQNVSKDWPHDIIFVDEAVSSLDRKRMIEHRIPFIIPGNQMFLPSLGIDLREHFRKLQVDKASFSPATQVFVLDALYNPKDAPDSPTTAAKRIGCTKMTMTRAFNELEKAGIGELRMVGKERQIKFPVRGKALWEQALPFLKDPVKKRMHIEQHARKRHWIESGFYALAEFSDLAHPNWGIYALDAGEFRLLVESGIPISPRSPGNDWIEIESWAYSPTRFAKKGIADPLSVFLMTMGEDDERVQMALKQVIKGMKW